jgi:hypothetical protein
MTLFHIPKNVSKKNLFKPQRSESAKFIKLSKQTFKQINSEEELDQAIAENKVVVTLPDKKLKRLKSCNVITELVDQPEVEASTTTHSSCNLHILSPIYSATNKFLGTGVILLGVGAPVAVAVPVALVGAACNFWVQYQFITKTATGAKALDIVSDENQTLTWKDELMAAVNIVSSITEGAGFAVGVYLGADANGLSIVPKAILASIAFKFKQGTTMQADGQKIFIEQGKDFSATRVGKIANLTQQFPPKYPFLLDFNSWVRDFLPSLESLLPAMAFNAFLQKRLDNSVVCALLATLVSSGEWYQQRGFSVNIIKHVQQLSDVTAPLGLAHLVDIIIRVYNESIGNLVNGRIVNDVVGIVIPPAIWNLIIKLAGNFFTGYVGGRQVLTLLPAITDKLGFAMPGDLSTAETILKPVIGGICAIAGISQYMAGYDKNLAGLPIGIKPLLEKHYGTTQVADWGLGAVRARAVGLTNHIKRWPQRFFEMGQNMVQEVKDYPCFKKRVDEEDELDLEQGLETPLNRYSPI